MGGLPDLEGEYIGMPDLEDDTSEIEDEVLYGAAEPMSIDARRAGDNLLFKIKMEVNRRRRVPA